MPRRGTFMGKIYVAKLTLGAVLALLVLATLGGLLYLGTLQATMNLDDVTVPVEVRGPHTVIHDDDVAVSNATAYAALQAAARESNFTVRTTDYGGRVFVEAVAGHENEGMSGWVYGVTVPDRSGLCYPDVAANRYALDEGQELVWHWSDSPKTVEPCR